MNKKTISAGVDDEDGSYDRFVAAWNNATSENDVHPEVHLNFEDFAMLAAVLTPKRLELLKVLRREGPMSIRALSKMLSRDYKNVHMDSTDLEGAGLIWRNDEGQVTAPWDVIDARFSLVA